MNLRYRQRCYCDCNRKEVQQLESKTIRIAELKTYKIVEMDRAEALQRNGNQVKEKSRGHNRLALDPENGGNRRHPKSIRKRHIYTGHRAREAVSMAKGKH